MDQEVWSTVESLSSEPPQAPVLPVFDQSGAGEVRHFLTDREQMRSATFHKRLHRRGLGNRITRIGPSHPTDRSECPVRAAIAEYDDLRS